MNRLTFTTAVTLLLLSPWPLLAQEPKFDPHSLAQAAASEKVNTPSTPATSNPWDKYQAAPAQKAPSSPTAPAATESTPAAPSPAGANPWDKYQAEPGAAPKKETQMPTPAATEGAPSVDDDLPRATGDNPWDKYQPAPSPVKRKKNVAKVKERPAKLELAQPLPALETPQGERVIKNNLPVGIDNYFAIEYAGKLVGYSHFRINRLLTLGGQSTYVLDSSSRIKLGIDTVQDLQFTANAQIDKKTLSPALFLCVQGKDKSAKDAMTVNCIYSEDFIAQNNDYAGKTQGYLQKFPKGQPPLLVFNNLWGHLDTFPEHYWLLVRAAAEGGVLETYDPILQGIGQTIVYKPIKEMWTDAQGQKHTTLVYRITDVNSAPLAYVRLYAKDYQLAEIKEIGSGFTFRRSNKAVVPTVAKSSGQRIKANAELSNVYFQDPEQLSHLEAFLDLRLRGGELAQHEVKNYKQQFYGELKEGRMNGRAVVSTSLGAQEPKTPFPFREETPPELQKYLEACPGVELEVGALKTKALEITWKSENAFQAASRINGYVANQIAEGVALPSARQTLENQVGNPESKALLMVALLRALKIPARSVGGLVYRRGAFVAHRWVEAWFGAEEGWVPFDPTTNESGLINASHIALWESGDLQAMDIYVEKFAPRPPRTVSYFKEPLKWPMGEKRTYSIYHKGELIGLESSHMYDMEVEASGENYNFKSESVLLREEKPLIFESMLTMNAQGLPVAFRSSEDNGTRVQSEAFTFQGNSIWQDLELKPTPSLPRPAKSKARLEEEKRQAEAEAAQAEAQPEEEVTAPALEPVPLPAAPVVTPSPSEAASTAAAAPKEEVQEEVKEEATPATPEEAQLAQGLDKAAQGDSQEAASASTDEGSTQLQEAISPEERQKAEEEAAAQAKEEATKERRAQLVEIMACYEEGQELERARQEEAQAAAAELEATSKQEAPSPKVEGQKATAPAAKGEQADHKAKKEADSASGEEPIEDHEPKRRQIPYSIGTYLIDQRFLSQWALVVEQSPAVVVQDDTPPSSAAASLPGAPQVDPNLGIVGASEIIAPPSADSAAPEKDADGSTTTTPSTGAPTGETGAGTFNTPSTEDEGETFTFHAFIPGALRLQELTLQRADVDESLTMPNGETLETARLDTEKGMIFYLDLETGKVVKISIPSQELEMYLEESRFEL